MTSVVTSGNFHPIKSPVTSDYTGNFCVRPVSFVQRTIILSLKDAAQLKDVLRLRIVLDLVRYAPYWLRPKRVPYIIAKNELFYHGNPAAPFEHEKRS